MSNDPILDDQLTQYFGAQRAADARRAPAFAGMLAAAQDATVDGRAMDTTTPVVRAMPRRWRARAMVVAVPVLAAAGLLLMLRPSDSNADREFEALVAEWSRTTTETRASPTDALLSLPGDQYLRRMPTLGGDQLPSRSGKPS